MRHLRVIEIAASLITEVMADHRVILTCEIRRGLPPDATLVAIGSEWAGSGDAMRTVRLIFEHPSFPPYRDDIDIGKIDGTAIEVHYL